MSDVRVLYREHVRSLVIQCPDRCEGRGCNHLDSDDGWRTSKRLPSDMPIDKAREVMEEHVEMYPKSGPYRLVEYVTETKATVEIIEEMS